jgi:hypothetical protein
MILVNLFLAREIMIFFIVFAAGMLALTFGGIIWMTSIWDKMAEELRKKRELAKISLSKSPNMNFL